MSGHITKLTYLRNGGLRVFVDGQALCVIDAADWGAFGLSKGDALSGESGEALQQCAQRFEARKRAAASLACQAYSAKGLERRLRQKGTPAQAAQEAVEHYRSLGYLEDGVFAQNLAQRLHETKLCKTAHCAGAARQGRGAADGAGGAGNAAARRGGTAAQP